MKMLTLLWVLLGLVLFSAWWYDSNPNGEEYQITCFRLSGAVIYQDKSNWSPYWTRTPYVQCVSKRVR
jgi:hypothetical protein